MKPKFDHQSESKPCDHLGSPRLIVDATGTVAHEPRNLGVRALSLGQAPDVLAAFALVFFGVDTEALAVT